MAESMSDKKSKWFVMQPTDDFLELMYECEEKNWDWKTFLKNVEEHFREHQPDNKGKDFKEASVLQKAQDCNKKLEEHDCPIVVMPFPTSTRVNWKQRAAERKAKMQGK